MDPISDDAAKEFKRKWAMEIMVRMLEMKKFELAVLRLSLSALEETDPADKLLINMETLRQQAVKLSDCFDLRLALWDRDAVPKNMHALLYERAKGHPGTTTEIARWVASTLAAETMRKRRERESK